MFKLFALEGLRFAVCMEIRLWTK